MGASKRSNYAGSSGRRNAGGEALRNVGVVLGLGGLSFFLGFFVLSHMVPDKHDESSMASATPGQHREPSAQASPAPSPSPSAVASAPTDTSASPSRTFKPQDGKGPTIEPAEETASQKPAPLDGADTASATAADTSDSAASSTGIPPHPADATGTTHRKARHSRSPEGASTSANADSDPQADNGGFKEGDQKPSKIDPDGAAADTAKSDKTDNSESANGAAPKAEKSVTKSALYRVRGGTHSRREEAEREAHRITDLGLEATVVPVTTDDGTVYRVQQGVYRKRANAESARQKLADAGIDAEIVRARR